MNDTTQIPEGFQEVELDWSELPAVDWNNEESIQGVVVAGRYVMLDKGDFLGATMLLRLRTERGDFVVWESARLVEFFAKLRVTDEILIRHVGMKPIKDNRRVHVFQAFVKPGPERTLHPAAFGLRPDPRPIPRQMALPGMDPTKTDNPAPKGFDDDIPF